MLLSEAEDKIKLYANGKYRVDLTQSETLSTWRSPLHGTWEISSASVFKPDRLMKVKTVR